MSKSKYFENEEIINKVLKSQDDDLKSIKDSKDKNLMDIKKRIRKSKELLTEFNIDYSSKDKNLSLESNPCNKPITVDRWENIASRAEKKYPDIINIEDLFTQKELKENDNYFLKLQEEFKDINKLDKLDLTTAGIIGTIAALIDFFLVTKVSMNGSGTVKPGSLKSGVENLWDKILPADKVTLLEKKYKVPFDISTNTSKISQEVLGLNPSQHRFQSLGHDPILGFIFGVKDLMKGELTAIDGNGRKIIQSVSGAEGKNFFESVIKVFGHLLSDVNAISPKGKKLSIPAPFTPLLQMVQKGNILYKGKNYTIGDLSRRMYSDGYNFNHFIGMSIPVVLIDIVIRLYTVLRDMFSENYISTKRKSNIMLFTANSILCAENVGKVVVTENPFSVNYVSWLNTARYATKCLKYALVDYQLEEIKYVQKIIDQEFEDTYDRVENTWNEVCSDRQIIYL